MKHITSIPLCLALFLPNAGSAMTLALDFEDGSLPSAYGWGQSPNQPSSAIASIRSGSAPGAGGNNVMNIVGPENFGWYYDLDGLIDASYSWRASVDFRQVADNRRNEPGLNSIGLVWNSPFGNAQANSTAPAVGVWQTLEISYDASTGIFLASVDGISQTPSTAQGGLYPLSVQTSLSFGWGNGGKFQNIDYDNFYFSAEQLSAIPIPASGLFLVGGMAALGLARRRH